ncbi:hypothetical protein [Chitinophaga sp.]|uniref:hypothetical protein n=1 Tax=Chitinophaga sp. TaxID=1869181 RepID=UPI002F92DD5B
MDQLTNQQAYTAMCIFLDALYERTKSADLAGFLGGFQLLADGTSADPAAWQDWMIAVNKVLSEKKI